MPVHGIAPLRAQGLIAINVTLHQPLLCIRAYWLRSMWTHCLEEVTDQPFKPPNRSVLGLNPVDLRKSALTTALWEPCRDLPGIILVA